MPNTRSGTRDLTVGRPLTGIALFAVPLIFGTLFQQLYSFVDTAVVGRCVGVQALAAVGTTNALGFLVLGFVQGIGVGFGIPLAQSFGARDRQRFAGYFWNGCYLAAAFSLALGALTFAFAGPLLTLMRTPSDVFAEAAVYIRIIFLGLPASLAYNYSAAALRAVGDSKHPFYFLLFTSALNIGLDLLFVAGLRWGVAGAAWATVASQTVSAVLNLWWLFARTGAVPGWRDRLPVSGAQMAVLCKVGLPMAFEYAVSAIGSVVLQGAINSLGSVAVAAQTTGERIRMMFTLPMESVGMAIATYAGQNYGARRLDRVRAGLGAGLFLQWGYCALAWVVIYFLKGPAVALVLGTGESPAAALAVEYLVRISTMFAFHGALMVFRNTLQGLGYSLQAILGGVGEILGRSIGSWLAVAGGWGFTAICYANPMAWVCSLIYCALMVRHYLRKAERA